MLPPPQLSRSFNFICQHLLVKMSISHFPTRPMTENFTRSTVGIQYFALDSDCIGYWIEIGAEYVPLSLSDCYILDTK